MSRITFNLKTGRGFAENPDIDAQLARMPNPARAAVVQAASVLNITRAAVQNDPSDDIEMIPRSLNSDSFDDSEFISSQSGHWHNSYPDA